MRRLLFSPRWVIGHLLVLGAFATCLWLGWWQLGRFESPTGGPQNVGYALQWPVFGGFVLFFWARVLMAELRPSEPPAAGRDRPRDTRTRATPTCPEPGHPSAGDPAAGDPAAGNTVAVGPEWEDPEPADPELAAYNRYLAELHAADAGPERGE